MSFSDIPLKYRLAAFWQWFLISLIVITGTLLTYFPMGPLVALTGRASSKHPQGKALNARHSQKYLDLGASGWWEYWNSPYALLRPWNNYEDGLLGEPSGKTSARDKGRERKRWFIYLWLCRNPFNWAKRSSRLLACFPNDCDIDWWGSAESITDKAPVAEGWYFVRAKDRTTGRVYYGYRSVTLNSDGTVNQARIGYKVEPRHAREVQDADDLDKAFTLRYQMHAEAD
ncbi:MULTISPECIES: DUF7338 family protein [Pseudomonas]|uniref:Uncharacterized protein n=1 Tax=Pseudomonas lutea TaxID=243924 RepID=A0A9X8QLP2_9PSED|nr:MULTISPECIES: hypothetical protein [Pseudomonas]SER35818.1 hypothetical protein SAMN05216409_11826 [Pseudomonas lutea]